MQGETSRAEKKKPKTTKTAFPLNVKLAAKESQSPQIGDWLSQMSNLTAPKIMFKAWYKKLKSIFRSCQVLSTTFNYTCFGAFWSIYNELSN